ncbi:MAG: flagellar hook capping protein [Lachnospiraceae bacterium]|nr:flagellar hook capping protein [Lachnospiraceae bacterium]
MSSIANVVNGQITNNSTSAASVNKAVESSNKQAGGALDKDAFLKLLVTQMKYQDPLQPTDNTEYVSQLATFSELEEMQNMSASLGKQNASSLIGQYVYIEETDSTGNTKMIEGTVDYVSFSGSKTYLSIEGTLYNYDDLVSVADADYTLAVKLADTFAAEISKLPALSALTKDNLETVGSIVTAYSNMTTYQRSFINEDVSKLYNEYAQWYMTQMKELNSEGQDAADGDDSSIA